MKPRAMCHKCPWRRPKAKYKQARFAQIAKDVVAGKYLVHACHLQTTEMIPVNDRQECQGHKRHLIKLGLLTKEGQAVSTNITGGAEANIGQVS